MKARLALAAMVLASGCAGVSSREVDGLRAQLARIEDKVDALAAQAPPDNAVTCEAPNGAKLAKLAELARVAEQIEALKAEGFTDSYPPLQQLSEELRRLVKAVSEMPSTVAASERPR
jgi:hypothetical protein